MASILGNIISDKQDVKNQLGQLPSIIRAPNFFYNSVSPKSLILKTEIRPIKDGFIIGHPTLAQRDSTLLDVTYGDSEIISVIPTDNYFREYFDNDLFIGDISSVVPDYGNEQCVLPTGDVLLSKEIYLKKNYIKRLTSAQIEDINLTTRGSFRLDSSGLSEDTTSGDGLYGGNAYFLLSDEFGDFKLVESNNNVFFEKDYLKFTRELYNSCKLYLNFNNNKKDLIGNVVNENALFVEGDGYVYLDYDDGVYNKSLKFNGHNSLEIEDFNFEGDNGFAVSFWMKNIYEGRKTIFEKDLGNGKFFSISCTSSNRILSVSETPAGDFILPATPFTQSVDNVWTHFVLSYDKNTNKMSVYSNGIFDKYADITGTLSTLYESSLKIGNGNLGFYSGAFTGWLDEMSFFNRPVTPNEVEYLYSGSLNINKGSKYKIVGIDGITLSPIKIKFKEEL